MMTSLGSSSLMAPKLSIGKTLVHFQCYRRDEFNKLSEEEKLFEYSKSISKKRGMKNFKFLKNGQNFSESSSSKMFTKELEDQKNAESNKEEDEEKLGRTQHLL